MIAAHSLRTVKWLCVGLFLLLAFVRGTAAEVAFDNGNVTFNAPDGFTPLSQAEIAVDFPRRPGPMDAVGNDLRDTCISYSILGTRALPAQLSELKTTIANVLEQELPGLQWIKRDFADINGTRWVLLEATWTLEGKKIHNIQIVTTYRHYLLMMNFSTTEELFSTYGDGLSASLKSVKIKSQEGVPALAGGAAPKTAGDFASRGMIALGAGNLDMAGDAFRAALGLNPELADAKIGLGRINAAKESYSDAVRDFSEAIVDDPKSYEAYVQRAYARAELGQFSQAFDDTDKAEALRPRDAEAVCARADVEMLQGDFDEAWKDNMRALTLDPARSSAHDGLGRIQMIRGNYDEARLDFRAASFRSGASLFGNLALLNMLTDKPEDALLALKNVAEIDRAPIAVEHTRLLSWAILANRGQLAAANEMLTAYTKDNAGGASPLGKSLAKYLLGQGSEADVLEAAKSDNKFLSRKSECAAYYFIGTKRHADKYDAGAEEAFRKCIATGRRSVDTYILARAKLPAAEVEKLESAQPDADGPGGGLKRAAIVVVALATLGGLVVIAIVAFAYLRPRTTPKPKQARSIERAPPLKK